uniref:Uncharacterized protein n=1 Tax=Rhizophora mucronata TaxID=61149 RepID=A0A2P2LEM7_RHIMU
MRGYDRDEVEDYDEYEDYGEEQEEEEEGEYEHEDEVERKPSAEELKYLQLRERIKERIRQKHQKQSDSSHNKSQDKKTKLPSNNYGSFFGSSQPVVAQRVIEESKSLLENQHLAFQVSNSHDAVCIIKSLRWCFSLAIVFMLRASWLVIWESETA